MAWHDRVTTGYGKAIEVWVRLRIPGWCQHAQSHSERRGVCDTDRHLEQGYVRVERMWQSGDSVDWNLAMSVKRMYANPNVRQDAGCVALQRGPLVYCLEGVTIRWRCIVSSCRNSRIGKPIEADMLEGVIIVRGNALVEDEAIGQERSIARRRPRCSQA